MFHFIFQFQATGV